VDLKLCLVDKLKTFCKKLEENNKFALETTININNYLPALVTVRLHAKLTVWGLGIMKARPKSIPLSGSA